MKKLVGRILKNICITYLTVSLFMTIAVVIEIGKERKAIKNNSQIEQLPIVEVIDNMQLNKYIGNNNNSTATAYSEVLSGISFILSSIQFIILLVAVTTGSAIAIVDNVENKRLAKKLNNQLQKQQ